MKIRIETQDGNQEIEVLGDDGGTLVYRQSTTDSLPTIARAVVAALRATADEAERLFVKSGVLPDEEVIG